MAGVPNATVVIFAENRGFPEADVLTKEKRVAGPVLQKFCRGGGGKNKGSVAGVIAVTGISPHAKNSGVCLEEKKKD